MHTHKDSWVAVLQPEPCQHSRKQRTFRMQSKPSLHVALVYTSSSLLRALHVPHVQHVSLLRCCTAAAEQVLSKCLPAPFQMF
jgi:hypothetical protein